MCIYNCTTTHRNTRKKSENKQNCVYTLKTGEIRVCVCTKTIENATATTAIEEGFGRAHALFCEN